MPSQYIREIKPGDQVDATFFMQKRTLVPFRDPSKGHYLALTLSDRTGQIQARLWDRAGEVAGTLAETGIVQVRGAADSYRDQVQLTITEIAMAAEPERDVQSFLPVSRSDIHKLRAKLEQIRLSITDEHLIAVLASVFQTPGVYDAYTSFPAGKQVHHAYVGGLLEHSLEVVEFCELAVRLYPGMFNRDLLVAGALLHDIGKIEEYSMIGAIDITTQGRLTGHTALGLRMLDKAIAAVGTVPAALAEHLAHLVLAHHGDLEAGAAILPQTPEAMALHLADVFSAKIKQFEQVIASGGDAQWSPFDRLLGRSLYSGFAKG